jgi:hypothetical protein
MLKHITAEIRESIQASIPKIVDLLKGNDDLQASSHILQELSKQGNICIRSVVT